MAPHATGDVIALANVIAETSAFAIKNDSTLTAQSLCGKELGGVVWVTRVHKTSWVNLDVLQTDGSGSDGLTNVNALSLGVISVSGRQVAQVRSDLLQEGICDGTSGTVSTGSEDDGICGELDHLIVSVQVLNTANTTVGVLQQSFEDAIDEKITVAVTVGELFVLLHECGGDLHARELSTALGTVGTLVRVATHAAHNIKGKAKVILEPSDGVLVVLNEHIGNSL
jgi:hypothetical protein